jgi:hypothetical protein
MCKIIQFPRDRERSVSHSPNDKKHSQLRSRSFLDFVSTVHDKLHKGQISMETAHAMLEAFLIMQGEE